MALFVDRDKGRGRRGSGSRGDRENPIQSDLRDLYADLGLTRGAKPEAITRAYRDIARTDHPSITDNPEANLRFARAAAAKDVLLDRTRRREYDRKWAEQQKEKAKRDWYAQQAELEQRQFEADPAYHLADIQESERILEKMVKEYRHKQAERRRALARDEARRDPSGREAAEARADYTFATKWFLEEADTQPGRAQAAQDLETAVRERASANEPRFYRADGRYLRVSHWTERRDVDGLEEYVTTAEWIAPRRENVTEEDPGNYPPSEGIIIRREQSTVDQRTGKQLTGAVWMGRVTCSYRARTFAPMPETNAFVFTSGDIAAEEITKMCESLPLLSPAAK